MNRSLWRSRINWFSVVSQRRCVENLVCVLKTPQWTQRNSHLGQCCLDGLQRAPAQPVRAARISINFPVEHRTHRCESLAQLLRAQTYFGLFLQESLELKVALTAHP